MKVVRKNEEIFEIKFIKKGNKKKEREQYWDRITIEHVMTIISRRNNKSLE